MSNTAILILAAGSSSRMGKVKQLLPYKHTTILGWAIEQAQTSIAEEVFCVLGANSESIKESIEEYKVTTVLNPDYKKGLSSSIACGIKELLDKEAVLITLADQPMITNTYLNQLLDALHENPDKIIVSNYGTSVGVPAVFPKKYYGDLLLLEGDKGAKNFLNHRVSDSVKIGTADLTDIDLPEDYSKLKRK